MTATFRNDDGQMNDRWRRRSPTVPIAGAAEAGNARREAVRQPPASRASSSICAWCRLPPLRGLRWV